MKQQILTFIILMQPLLLTKRLVVKKKCWRENDGFGDIQWKTRKGKHRTLSIESDLSLYCISNVSISAYIYALGLPIYKYNTYTFSVSNMMNR